MLKSNISFDELNDLVQRMRGEAGYVLAAYVTAGIDYSLVCSMFKPYWLCTYTMVLTCTCMLKSQAIFGSLRLAASRSYMCSLRNA